jgi:hypothetical protein
VIDSNVKELFSNDLDKKYTPTAAPTETPGLIQELIEEEEGVDRRKLAVAVEGQESEDAPYSDWAARVKAKALHYPNNKPTPGPTYVGGRTTYEMEDLKLTETEWRTFNGSDLTDRLYYPDGTNITKGTRKTLPPAQIVGGFGKPTISFRNKVCMLEGVVSVVKQGMSSSTIAMLSQKECWPKQDRVFVLAGSTDLKQPGCGGTELESAVAMIELQDGVKVGGDSGFKIVVRSTGAVQAYSSGPTGLSQWCYISLSGIMWPKNNAEPEVLTLEAGYEVHDDNAPNVMYTTGEANSPAYCFVGGLVAKGPATTSQTVTSLPVSCRPTEPQYYTVQGFIDPNGGQTALVTLRVGVDGKVVPVEMTQDVKWFSLAGVTIIRGQPPPINPMDVHGRHNGLTQYGITRRYLDIAPNWDNADYDTWETQNRKYPTVGGHLVGTSHDFGNATFTVDDDGYCRVQGRLELRKDHKPGGVIGNFTEDCLPFAPVVFNLRASVGVVVVKVSTSGDIVWVSDGPTPDAVAVSNEPIFLSLSGIAFNSFNHKRQTMGLERRCVSGRWENADNPCWKTTWRDVLHHWPGKMLRSVFHDMCWVGDDPIMVNDQVATPDGFVNAARVDEICRTLRTCIKAVKFWGNASNWEGECEAVAAQKRDAPSPEKAKQQANEAKAIQDLQERTKEAGLAKDKAQVLLNTLENLKADAKATKNQVADATKEAGDAELASDSAQTDVESARRELARQKALSIRATELLYNTTVVQCWSTKVRLGPVPGASWNPGSLEGDDPAEVWRTKKQYQPFSNPCAVMKLKMVTDHFKKWKIPQENGMPHREPPYGFPPKPMSFELTGGGLYGLAKPLNKLDWLDTQDLFSQDGADKKAKEYQTMLENSYCFNNPGLTQDQDRACPDPSAASITVSKKVAISSHNSTFSKYNLCLSWTGVNTGHPGVMSNPAHKKLTVPYTYKPCADIFRPKVVYTRLKWICGAADPLGWTPGPTDPVSNQQTDPVPFLIKASQAQGSDAATANIPQPEKFWPHLSGGKHHVWSPNAEVKKSCIKQPGAKYRCYKVPKYICYPGGKQVPIVKNGVIQTTGRMVNDISKPIKKLNSLGELYHARDVNGALMYEKMEEQLTQYQAGGVEDCLDFSKVTSTDANGSVVEKTVTTVKPNNWCLNTCIDKDEIARHIAQERALYKKSMRLNASFALLSLEFDNRRTVREEKVIQTDHLHEALSNETVLTREITNITSAYYNATSVDARVKEALAVNRKVNEKVVEEKKAKHAAKMLLNITMHEERLVKEKTAKNDAILKEYRRRWQEVNDTALFLRNAQAKLRELRVQAFETMAGWPAWIKSRYMKIEALPSGSCMFPAKCQASDWKVLKVLEITRPSNVLNPQALWIKQFHRAVFDKAMAWWARHLNEYTPKFDPISKKNVVFPANCNSRYCELAKQSASEANVKAVVMDAANFLVDADFCALEEDAGLHEKMDIFRLCEQQAYTRNEQCCADSSLVFASQLPSYKLRNWVIGGEKSWSDKQDTIKASDFEDGHFWEGVNSCKVVKKKNSVINDDDTVLKCGKLSNATYEQLKNNVLNDHEKYGRHVSYPMSKFKVKQEMDAMKDF